MSRRIGRRLEGHTPGGRAAAAAVRPGETILLDSGSTTIEIARHLRENAEITVVTCALNVALEAGSRAGVTVVVCGGTLNGESVLKGRSLFADKEGEMYKRWIDGTPDPVFFLGYWGNDAARDTSYSL
jgi:hypothetical protein